MKPSAPSCSNCDAWWRLPLMLALVFAAILWARRGGIRETTTDEAARVPPAGQAGDETGKTVSLAIDLGDGRRREFDSVTWREGMTVYDLTRDTPRNNAQLEMLGENAGAFLAGLDGVANEGADGRNWIYSVNGKPGDRSFAVYELAPGDQVLWSFASRR